MKKTLLALSLITVLILGVTYVYAQGPGHGPGWAGRTWPGIWESRKIFQSDSRAEGKVSGTPSKV